MGNTHLGNPESEFLITYCPFTILQDFGATVAKNLSTFSLALECPNRAFRLRLTYVCRRVCRVFEFFLWVFLVFLSFSLFFLLRERGAGPGASRA